MAGNSSDTVAIDATPAFLRDIAQRLRLMLASIPLKWTLRAMGIWYFTTLTWRGTKTSCAFMRIRVIAAFTGQTYHSIGGHFIFEEAQCGHTVVNEVSVPFRFISAQPLLERHRDTVLSVSGLVLYNKLTLHEHAEGDRQLFFWLLFSRPSAPV